MMDGNKSLRWGILGLGRIAHDFVLAHEFSHRPQQIVAIASSNSLERSQKFKDALRLSKTTKIYGDYKSLFEDSDVDIVYIANLNGSHYDCVMKALNNGKNVLCEKALAVNALQIREMCQLAREKGLFLMESQWSRFFPSWQELWRTIKSEEYGKPLFVDAKFCANLGPERFDLSQGECPLLDIGIYTIMFALFVFKGRKVCKINCVGQLNLKGCDLWANITLEFEDGAHAILYYNGTACNSNSASVTFERGQITFPETFWSSIKLYRTTDPFKMSENSEEQIFPIKNREKKLTCLFNFINSEGFCYEIDHVYDCILQGKTESDIAGLDESLRIMEIMDEVKKQLGVKI